MLTPVDNCTEAVATTGYEKPAHWREVAIDGTLLFAALLVIGRHGRFIGIVGSLRGPRSVATAAWALPNLSVRCKLQDRAIS